MLTQNQIIEYIDSMEIYEEEYDIIKNLLQYTSPTLFTKIIEEIIEGNLFFSDFKNFLSTNENFNIMLKDSISLQKKLEREIKNLTIFRKNIFKENSFFLEDTNLGIKENDGEIYNENIKNIYDDFAYSLLQVTSKDSEITKAVKAKLFNALENQKLLLNGTLLTDNLKKIEENQFTHIYTDPDDPSSSISEKVLYISPKDLILSVNSYILPISSRYQVLDESDRNFMKLNNISEEELKKIKSVSMFLRKKDFNGG